MTTTRFCNLCQHSIRQSGDLYCAHPRPANPIDGTAPKLRLCAVERDKAGGCGPIGRWWDSIKARRVA